MSVTAKLHRRRRGWLKRRHAKSDRCYYCTRRTLLVKVKTGGIHPPNLCTLDHYVPLFRGGSEDFENYRLACTECNRLKGDLDPAVFLAELRLWGIR